MNNLLISPRLTEKSYLLATQGIYTFNVPLAAGRQQIAASIAAAYGVDVESVKIIRQFGKIKFFNRNKRAFRKARQDQDFKKALVRLKSGQTIPAFEQLTGDASTDKKETK